MKKIFTSIILAAAVLTGCNDQVIMPKGDGSFSVSVDELTDQYVTKSDVVLDANEFDWVIEGEYAEFLRDEQRGGKVKDMPTIFDNIPEGTYTITVSSSETKVAAFDQPIISGSQEFVVKAGEITSVQVRCSIQNVKVTIDPTEEFFAELATYTITVSNGDDAENKLIWTNEELAGANYASLTKDNVLEAKSGYFTVGSALEIEVTGYRAVTEQEATYSGVISPIAAKDHYIIKLHAQTTGQLGSGASAPGVSLIVDYKTNDVNQDVNVPGFDLPPVEGPDDPSTGGGEDDELVGLSLEWPANPEYGLYELKSSYGEDELKISLYAENVIEGFIVKITSPTVAFLNIVKQLPGVTAEGEYAVLDFSKPETATAMNFLTVNGQPIIGETQVDFALGTLLPMVLASSPEIGTIHTFIMQVTDKAGQVLTKELQFEYRGN